MDDGGYTVYRYKKYYFGTYRSPLPNPDPEELGERVLEEARSGLRACKQRLEDKILRIDELMKSEEDAEEILPSPDFISATAWDAGIDTEWTHIIDLDRDIFQINNAPFFSLNNLPPPQLALVNLIGEDSYGNLACLDEKYRFRTIQPPLLEDTALRPYHQLLHGGNNAVSYVEMLELSEHLARGEEVRLHLLQTIVGYSMTLRNAPTAILEFGLAANRDEISDEAWNFAISIANIAFAPPIFYSLRSDWLPYRSPSPCSKRQDFCWVRSDTLIHITPHLGNDQHMQAAISRVVEEALRRDKAGTIYGVLFSFFHCIIVKIDKDASASFIHTPPLEFIPSWFAKEPSTPGMTALTRLGYRLDSELYLKPLPFHGKMERAKVADETMDHPEDPDPYAKVRNDCGYQDHIPPSRRIPAEIWLHIAAFLPSVDSVLRFGLVAKALQKVALTILRNPHIDNWRLLKVENCTESPQLATAKFAVVREDHHKIVHIGRVSFHTWQDVHYIRIFPQAFKREFWGSYCDIGFIIQSGD
ncbi:hypothetical protein BJ138DRAFT_1153791 [Hygrophoropsis aurantiaca]|uniref:Uncharacterized protein n=1 Tax=Hygrophoropsis aurantiaca TaxID=72124 RepID=A0ACB8A9U3_9AGAM|nr:hypothetical protein BJ138DRAFT_1153791 [Hygrophoropsis aurantiaca]